MEAKEKLAVGGGLVNKLATVLEVLAVAGLDAIAAIWVLAKEDKVEQGILTPGNVLVADELIAVEVDIALAHEVVEVDLRVHGKVDNPEAVAWGLDTLLCLEEGADLGAGAMEVVVVGRDEGPCALGLGLDSPLRLSGGRLCVALDVAVAVTVQVLAQV